MSANTGGVSIPFCANPQLLERVKALCRKSGEEDCTCSVVSKVGPETTIKCHCGATFSMYENRLQNAEKHQSNPIHLSKSKQKRSAKRYFSNLFKASNEPNVPVPSARRQAVEFPCAGLNDRNWHRPKARPENSISAFSERSLLRERGASRIDKNSYEITGKRGYSRLNDDQLALVEQQRLAEVTYSVEKGRVRSVACKRRVQCPGTMNLDQAVCESCLALKQDRSLITPLNPKQKVAASSGENGLHGTAKYTPDYYLRPDPIQQSIIRNSQLKDLAKSAEQVVNNGSEEEFWKVMYSSALAGKLKNHAVVVELLQAVLVKINREEKGHSLRGMKYGQHLDDLFMTMASISPKAGSLFADYFAGRSIRSMLLLRKKEEKIVYAGFDPRNFRNIKAKLEEMGYHGPLACSTDQTVCLEGIRYYDGCLVGSSRGDIPVQSLGEISDLMKEIIENGDLASKIRIYTIRAPLPKCPVFVAVLIASDDNEDANTLYSLHDSFLKGCNDSGLLPLGLGTDGSATEFSAGN